MLSKKRRDMLGGEIRSVIAPILRECPPLCGIASIVGVDVSSDSSYATVSVSSLRNPEDAITFLESRLPELQRKVSRLPIKKSPKLRFRLDRAGEQGARIDELLR